MSFRADDPSRGAKAAKVTIVLFSDFQCPFCARVGPTLDRVKQEYGEKVRWWPAHPEARAEVIRKAREAVADRTFEQHAKVMRLKPVNDTVWAVQIGEATMQVRDLPIAVLDALGRSRGVSWDMLVVAPCVDLHVAEALVAECAHRMGVEAAPDETVRDLQRCFRLVYDDLPSLLEGGRPVDGRPEDGWMAVLCRPPWNFTPRQVREDFNLRDLQLMAFVSEASHGTFVIVG